MADIDDDHNLSDESLIEDEDDEDDNVNDDDGDKMETDNEVSFV